MTRVLAVFANPRGSDALRLGEEDRAIRECIRRSRLRDDITLTSCFAVTVKDIRRALLDKTYEVVHFSGHGTRSGLVFEDEFGAQEVPPPAALAALLKEYVPPLQCVLLNACYSTSQGRFTSMDVPFTIAMESPIRDRSAIDFAGAFYDAIAAGRDIEFSFRQGVHQLALSNSPDFGTPVLLRQGEVIEHPDPTAAAVPAPRQRSADVAGEPAEPAVALIGLAVDVSGTMEDNFDNRHGEVRSRLETVRRSLARFSDAELRRPAAPRLESLIFAYAFGLRSGEVADLFSMFRAAEKVMSPDEARLLGEKYAAELRDQYTGSGLGRLGGLMEDLGLGGLRAQAEDFGRHAVKQRVAAEFQRRLSQHVGTLPDTTLTLTEFAQFWKGSGGRLADTEPLIFGDTPMRTALIKVRDRFERELEKVSGKRVNPLLLLVSDGDPTDGDPEPVAAEIQALGVTIVSCYLTTFDLASPRRLQAAPAPGWPEGAARLFRMASALDDRPELSRRLLKEGWTIERGAAAFVQINHSETLDALVRALPAPLPGAADPLPKGR